MALFAAAVQNADAPALVAQNVAFGALALMMVGAALKVVTTKNVVHAALYLVIVLAGVAAQYILLAAEFLAAVQVLVYIGAIIVLFLFGIMLTRAPLGMDPELTRRDWIGAAVTGVGLLGLLAYVLIEEFSTSKLPEDMTFGTTAGMSDSIFGTYLLPFEIVSLLLTAALVGAIVIARKD